MLAKRLTPILNVSDIQQSFSWFEKLGWKKSWDWGTPADFGGICSGECEIFLCENAQGGRGKSTLKKTFGPEGDDAAEKGVWMSIGLTTWTPSTDSVLSRVSTSRGRQPTCRGMFARCMCGTPTATSSESAVGSRSGRRDSAARGCRLFCFRPVSTQGVRTVVF
jgi:hypothetical protein